MNVPRGAPPESRPRPHVTALLNQAGYFGPSHKALMESIFPRAERYGAYGMTELTNITMMSRSAEEIAHPGTLGEVFPGLDAQVTDDDGRPVEPGAIGELVFRGAQVCLGYYKNPAATAELFRDGWLRTGDLVRADEDGRLYFVDRAKDMIKSGGENVYSVEVEQVLLRFPGVIARVAAWLCTPEAQAVTGRVFAVVGQQIYIAESWQVGPSADVPASVSVDELTPIMSDLVGRSQGLMTWPGSTS